MGVTGERPGRRDFDIRVLDALIEEIRVFDNRRDDFGIFHLDDRVLAEETTTWAELIVVLEKYHVHADPIIAQGEFLDQSIGDLDLFLGVGFKRKELGDFFEESERADSKFGFM